MKRNDIQKRIDGLNVRNEPPFGIDLDLNGVGVRNYPDQYFIYGELAESLGVPDDYGVIIGNGCENMLGQVLRALDCASIGYSVPNWGMVQVIAEQLAMKCRVSDFRVECFTGSAEQPDEYVDVHYHTYPINNWIRTPYFEKPSRYSIIDVSYENPFNLRNDAFRLLRPDTIIIGGFQKTFGCALRFGFAIFHKTLSDRMNLFRENNLNLMIEVFMKQYRDKVPGFLRDKRLYMDSLRADIAKKLPESAFMLTDNYITLALADDVPLGCNHKTVAVKSPSRSVLCRFGIPASAEERTQLLDALEAVKNSACFKR